MDRDASIGPDGLTRRDRDLIRDVLARYPEVRRVSLFGSRAMGTFGRGSDIDLALEGPDLDSPTLTRIADELEDSDLPYKVDLLLRDEHLEPKLEAHIRRYGKPIGWKLHHTQKLIAEAKLLIGDGYRAKNSELATSGLPFARAGNIDNGFHFDNADRFPEEDIKKVGEKVSQSGDVVFASKGTDGRLALVRTDTPRFVYSPQLCYWRVLDRDVIDPCWLYYWMCGSEFIQQVAGMKGQTDMADYVSLTDQRRMEITLPPVSEQRAIAAVLGALDDKIEQNRRTAQALARLARAIFKAWFVDFEPVKAKAAGAASFPSMPQPVFDALPTRFIDSDLGPVPEGWAVKRLGDIVQFHNARRIPLSSRQRAERHGPYRYYGAAGIIDHVDDYLFDGVFTLVGEDGTVVTGPDRPMVQYVWGRFWVNNHAHVLTGASSSYTTEHVRVLLDHVNIRPFVTGAVQPKLNQGNLKSVPVVAAPRTITESFGAILTPLFDSFRQSEDESVALATLRDYLLPRLLSGKVRVREAEQFVGRVE